MTTALQNTPSVATTAPTWDFVKVQLEKDIGSAAARSWISPLSADISDDSKIIEIKAPTHFLKNWVESRYAERIANIWVRATGIAPQLRFSITGSATIETENPAMVSAADAPDAANQNRSFDGLQSVASPLDPRYTFDSFVTGAPNELAFAAAQRVAHSDKAEFNPLFLYGGVGLGKTHLMHAIAWEIQKKDPTRKVLYISAEKFMYQFIRAIRQKDTVAFKDMFRSVDVLMIDDLQFICGKESTQEEFFHTFNALVDQNRQIIISADKSPSDLAGLEERLKSRLGWGLVADLHPTTYELRLGILERKVALAGKTVSADVLDFLARKITSNVRELEGALNRLFAHADLIARPITLESAQDVLRDLLRAFDREITVEDIQKKVAEFYNIRMTDMTSSRRMIAIARPRQVAMYLSKKMTDMSLPKIGAKFGGRDHTTILHGVAKIEELIASDPSLRGDVAALHAALAA